MRDGLTYQRERYSRVIREALPLLLRHQQEVGNQNVPFDPNFDYFYALDVTNNLELVTLRSHGVLVGYCMNILSMGMHYKSTPWAVNNVTYVDPAFRSGHVGIRLILEAEKALRERKIKVFEMQPRAVMPALDRICERLKFQLVGTIRQKVLGD